MGVPAIPPVDAADDDVRFEDIPTEGLNVGSRGGKFEEQHIWIHCRDDRERDDVAEHCHQTQHLHRIPHMTIPDASEVAEWRHRVRLLLTEVPPPYAPRAWDEFVADIC